ncbi:hypothetical protein KY332_03130, partial [Candidatus Woesearchaeota archaeon]|nr:hypothetical protein [Candidatus Woesearchaeota archaeon]
ANFEAANIPQAEIDRAIANPQERVDILLVHDVDPNLLLGGVVPAEVAPVVEVAQQEYNTQLQSFNEQLKEYDRIDAKLRAREEISTEEQATLDNLKPIADQRAELNKQYPQYHSLSTARDPSSRTYEHLEAHLEGTEIGSVFIKSAESKFQTPNQIIQLSEEVLEEAYKTGKITPRPGWSFRIIRGSPPGGVVVIEAIADKTIGEDALVEITEENKDQFSKAWRTMGGRNNEVNVIDGKKAETNMMHIIGGQFGPTNNFGLFTTFPGQYAPAFNNRFDEVLGKTGTEFWNEHGFIAEEKRSLEEIAAETGSSIIKDLAEESNINDQNLVAKLNQDPEVVSDLEKIASSLEERGGRELRIETLPQLRTMYEMEAPKYEGFILDSILEENKQAFNKLRETIIEDNPDEIFVMERGGVFIGDILVHNTDLESRLNILEKVPDPKEKYRFDPEYVKSKLQEKIDAGANKIAIADTYMGGRFSREIRDQVIKPILNANPDVEFDIYWARETFGFEKRSAEGIPILTQFQGGFKETSPYAPRVRTHVEETRVVLGDDMDMIFEETDEPFFIFGSDGLIDEIIRPETTSREKLIALIAE